MVELLTQAEKDSWPQNLQVFNSNFAPPRSMRQLIRGQVLYVVVVQETAKVRRKP